MALPSAGYLPILHQNTPQTHPKWHGHCQLLPSVSRITLLFFSLPLHNTLLHKSLLLLPFSTLFHAECTDCLCLSVCLVVPCWTMSPSSASSGELIYGEQWTSGGWISGDFPWLKDLDILGFFSADQPLRCFASSSLTNQGPSLADLCH